MKEAINSFGTTFWLLLEVMTRKLEKNTLKTCWVFLILKRLPASFSVFWTIQFASLKQSESTLELLSFLKDLENKIWRQNEAALSDLHTSISTALAVSLGNGGNHQTPSSGNNLSQPSSAGRPPRPKCENNTHNPAVTSHTEENCHVAHPEKAVKHYKAAMESRGPALKSTNVPCSVSTLEWQTPSF
jgi:hypothetical protein